MRRYVTQMVPGQSLKLSNDFSGLLRFSQLLTLQGQFFKNKIKVRIAIC